MNFLPGKHTAIRGLLGSGKSTIGALIAKLYDPNQGKIILDGHDIQDLNVRHLRSYIGGVHQDSWLLNRLILEKIAHGLVSSLSGAHGDYEATLMGPSLSDLVEAVRGGQEFHRVVAAQRSTLANIVDLVREAGRGLMRMGSLAVSNMDTLRLLDREIMSLSVVRSKELHSFVLLSKIQ